MYVSRLSTYAPKVTGLESFTPLLLTIHGGLLLLTIGGTGWSWLGVSFTGLLALSGLVPWPAMKKHTAVRAALLFVVSTGLIAHNGGINSYFLLWYFVIVAVYPIVLQPSAAVLLPVGVAFTYFLLLFVDNGSMPPAVVGARSLLLLAIGFITQRLGAAFTEYLYDQTSLIENVSDAIISSDLNFTIRSWNHSAEAIYGWRAEEAVGQKVGAFLGTEFTGFTTQQVIEQFSSQGYWKGEVIQRRKDGAPLHILSAVGMIRNRTGHPIGAVAVNRDISERVQAEAQNQRQLRELTLLYEAARRLQQIYTPEGLAQELITIMEQILAYEFGAILLIDRATGKLYPFAVSDQGHGVAFVELDKEYILSHGLTVGEGITGWVAQTGQSLRLGDVHSDPRYHTMRPEVLSELCVPLRVGDTILGVLNIEATRYDAYTETDQRLLETLATQIALAVQQTHLQEEIRRHTAELEERVAARTTQLQATNQELEAFAYSVSHDLRTPLRAIEGFSSALLAHHAGPLDEQGRHYLDRIQQAAQRMGQLIDDLLKLSQLTRSELHYQRVNLSALGQTIANELQARDPQRQATFVIGDRIIVQGDQQLLHIVLQNLLENAWKFSNRRAVTHIEFGTRSPAQLDAVGQAKVAAHSAQSAGGRQSIVICFVRDNGIGFDMAYADRLFTPFQRLHSIAEFPGTGIGLATVQRILARHGGLLWAEAAVEQGTTFYFTLDSGNALS